MWGGYFSGGRLLAIAYDGGFHDLAAKILPLVGRWIDTIDIPIARIVVHPIYCDYLQQTNQYLCISC
jgi:hypothetical protein